MASIISVFGSSAPQPGSADYEAARDLGKRLAETGYVVQTGGYMGIMEAASQGAAEAGGSVNGVTCDQIETFRPIAANPWVTEEIRKPTLRQRVQYLVENCDGIIVLPGGIGTLSELALAWSFIQVGEIPAKPVILVGGLWQRTLAAFIDNTYVRPEHFALLTLARTYVEALAALEKTMSTRGT